MFDPKVLLDAIVAGAAHRPQDVQGGTGSLSDILGQLAKAAQPAQQQQELPQVGGQMTGGGSGRDRRHPEMPGQGAQQAGGGQTGIDIGEILRKLVAAGGTAPQANASPGGGGLSDLMGQILGKLSQGAPSTGQPSGTGIGGLGQVLGQILGQATAGVREGTGRINEAIGASEKIDDTIRQITGQSSPELVAKIKELIAQNQTAAGLQREDSAPSCSAPRPAQPSPRRRQARGPRADRRPRLQGLPELHPGPTRCRADGSAASSHTRPGRIWLRGRGADARSRPPLLAHDDRCRGVGRADRREGAGGRSSAPYSRSDTGGRRRIPAAGAPGPTYGSGSRAGL